MGSIHAQIPPVALLAANASNAGYVAYSCSQETNRLSGVTLHKVSTVQASMFAVFTRDGAPEAKAGDC